MPINRSCAKTANTITTRGAFWEEIRSVHENGNAEDLEENEQGVRCVVITRAWPHRPVTAALSISTLRCRQALLC